MTLHASLKAANISPERATQTAASSPATLAAGLYWARRVDNNAHPIPPLSTTGSGTRWSWTARALPRTAPTSESVAAASSLPRAKRLRQLDADGLVAAPGFVDIHSHGDLVLASGRL